MTNEEFESPGEDAGGPAGRQRTTDEILAGLAAKQTESKELLARLVKAVDAVEAQARHAKLAEEERGGC